MASLLEEKVEELNALNVRYSVLNTQYQNFIDNKVEEFNDISAKYYKFVHGTSIETVTVDSGIVKTLANLQATVLGVTGALNLDLSNYAGPINSLAFVRDVSSEVLKLEFETLVTTGDFNTLLTPGINNALYEASMIANGPGIIGSFKLSVSRMGAAAFSPQAITPGDPYFFENAGHFVQTLRKSDMPQIELTRTGYTKDGTTIDFWTDWESTGVPIGTVINSFIKIDDPIPHGYLDCHGQKLSKADYPLLWARLGDHFEDIIDNTMFHVPDCRNRSIRGYGYDPFMYNPNYRNRMFSGMADERLLDINDDLEIHNRGTYNLELEDKTPEGEYVIKDGEPLVGEIVNWNPGYSIAQPNDNNSREASGLVGLGHLYTTSSFIGIAELKNILHDTNITVFAPGDNTAIRTALDISMDSAYQSNKAITKIKRLGHVTRKVYSIRNLIDSITPTLEERNIIFNLLNVIQSRTNRRVKEDRQETTTNSIIARTFIKYA